MISVIIPVYNAERYIRTCLCSIQNQNYKDFEAIIVDDGSTDQSGKICDDYAQRDKRFKVIHKSNGGSASARNVALKNVEGDYIAFVDADDYVHPDYLKVMLDVSVKNDADIVQCNYKTTNTSEAFSKLEHFNEVTYNNIEFLGFFCKKKTYLKTAVLWNKLYKTALFNGIYFTENKGIDDEYVICNIIYNATSICEIDAILYYYYMSPDSQMRSKPTLKIVDSVDAVEQQLAFFSDIHQPHLHNALLYRYYSVIASTYNYVKEHYPTETVTIKELYQKKRCWRKALMVKEIPVSDKMLLIIRIMFPRFFDLIHRSLH